MRDPFAGMPESPGTLHPYSYSGNIPTVLTDPSGRCYPPLEFLRQVEPMNCHNLDMALKVWNHPKASTAERGYAASYMSLFGLSHSMLLAGAGILAWEAAAAGSGIVTAVSQWGSAQISAQVVGGTTMGQLLAGTGQALKVGATALNVGGGAYTVYEAAQGNPHAQTALANPGVYGAATLWNDLAEAGVAAFCRSTARGTQPFNARLTRDMIPDGGGLVDIQNAPDILIRNTRLIRKQDWAIWGRDASATAKGDFTYLAQSNSVQEALSRIPRSWRVESQASGVGYRFVNPDQAALVTEVRIKVPMPKHNRSDWRTFAQLRIGKYIGQGVSGADPFGIASFDRNLQFSANNDATHLRLEFDP